MLEEIKSAIGKTAAWPNKNKKKCKILSTYADQAMRDGSREDQISFLFATVFNQLHWQSDKWKFRCVTQGMNRTDIVIEYRKKGNDNPSRVAIESKPVSCRGVERKNKKSFAADIKKIKGRLGKGRASIGFILWWGVIWKEDTINRFNPNNPESIFCVENHKEKKYVRDSLLQSQKCLNLRLSVEDCQKNSIKKKMGKFFDVGQNTIDCFDFIEGSLGKIVLYVMQVKPNKKKKRKTGKSRG